MLLVGIQNDTTTMENILVISYKVKYSLSMCPGNSNPIYLSEIKTYSTQKPTYSCFIHNRQKQEILYMSLSQGMNKQTKACLCMKYYQVIKRDKLLIHTATEMNLRYIILNFKKLARNNYVLLYFCEILETAKLGVEKR